ncbi:DUF1810 domain-containing protein [Pelagerythrobacter sp.]|uniref:DUF1810 domain-containing protein n=1 Tax=Pelagerythrobacter sp. TaxID=2800702 RepID=UPI0035AFD9A9
MPGLSRFVEAQSGGVYERALAELRAGEKRSHWMWFVFPQIAGLGRSETARFYAIANRAEARDYLDHPQLGLRLREAAAALLVWQGRRSAETILGGIDALKLASSMTLFEAVADEPAPFAAVLDTFYDGKRDPRTLALI